MQTLGDFLFCMAICRCWTTQRFTLFNHKLLAPSGCMFKLEYESILDIFLYGMYPERILLIYIMKYVACIWLSFIFILTTSFSFQLCHFEHGLSPRLSLSQSFVLLLFPFYSSYQMIFVIVCSNKTPHKIHWSRNFVCLWDFIAIFLKENPQIL